MVVRNCQQCGRQVFAYPCDVRAGRKKFCSRTCFAKGGNHKTIHGMSRTRLYSIWRSMKTRCVAGRRGSSVYYHDLGIRVCREWIRSFVSFHKWAMEHGYKDGLELDRKDGNKGYFPENCRWATREQQMANTKKRRDGKTSGFKGVSWCSNVHKWRVQIGHNRKTIHVGLFDSEQDAARAYDYKARQVFGEFAKTNFME